MDKNTASYFEILFFIYVSFLKQDMKYFNEALFFVKKSKFYFG